LKPKTWRKTPKRKDVKWKKKEQEDNEKLQDDKEIWKGMATKGTTQ
jgi:hypothetical protein